MNLGQTEHQPNCDRFNTNLYLSVVQKRIRSWNIVRWFRSRFFSWQAMCLFQVSADPPPPPAASPGGSVTGVRVETVKAAMMPAARVAPGRVPADRSFGPARCWRQFRVDTPWFLLLRLLCWTVRETCCFAHPDQSPPAPSASCLELKLVENKNKHTLQDESCAGRVLCGSHLRPPGQRLLRGFCSSDVTLTTEPSNPRIWHFLYGVWLSATEHRAGSVLPAV